MKEAMWEDVCRRRAELQPPHDRARFVQVGSRTRVHPTGMPFPAALRCCLTTARPAPACRREEV